MHVHEEGCGLVLNPFLSLYGHASADIQSQEATLRERLQESEHIRDADMIRHSAEKVACTRAALCHLPHHEHEQLFLCYRSAGS